MQELLKSERWSIMRGYGSLVIAYKSATQWNIIEYPEIDETFDPVWKWIVDGKSHKLFAWAADESGKKAYMIQGGPAIWVTLKGAQYYSVDT